MFIALSFDKQYGGFYISRGWSWRVCLGWVAITVMPMRFDDFARWAVDGGSAEMNYKHIENTALALGGTKEVLQHAAAFGLETAYIDALKHGVPHDYSADITA